MPAALRAQIRGNECFEIISLDSALIYRGMDIGTAKPNAQERTLIRHHLIDIRDPHQHYSAAEFRHDCIDLVAQIHARGHRVLLVGGTMMYYHALIKGLSDLPERDAEIRADLHAQAQKVGWPELHARLAKLDPETAQHIAPQDQQRIERALEIWQLSGLTPSQLRTRSSDSSMQKLPFPLLTIGLIPHHRAQLHARINARFDAMLAEGFLNEVAQLMARGDLDPNMGAMRAVGYRQAWQYLHNLKQRQQNHPPISAEGLAAFFAFREQACAATRQLAKRQLTWLRKTRLDEVIDPFAVIDPFEATDPFA